MDLKLTRKLEGKCEKKMGVAKFWIWICIEKKRMNARINERMNERMNEKMNERINERMNERMNE